jgi:hypothetical protein
MKAFMASCLLLSAIVLFMHMENNLASPSPRGRYVYVYQGQSESATALKELKEASVGGAREGEAPVAPVTAEAKPPLKPVEVKQQQPVEVAVTKPPAEDAKEETPPVKEGQAEDFPVQRVPQAGYLCLPREVAVDLIDNPGPDSRTRRENRPSCKFDLTPEDVVVGIFTCKATEVKLERIFSTWGKGVTVELLGSSKLLLMILGNPWLPEGHDVGS